MAGKTFERQTVLLQEINEAQKKCDHTLVIINSSSIRCPQCSALWIWSTLEKVNNEADGI